MVKDKEEFPVIDMSSFNIDRENEILTALDESGEEQQYEIVGPINDSGELLVENKLGTLTAVIIPDTGEKAEESAAESEDSPETKLSESPADEPTIVGKQKSNIVPWVAAMGIGGLIFYNI